jgi:hypothetical protein
MIKHVHHSHDYVEWHVPDQKKPGKGGFYLPTSRSELIEWKIANQETNFSVIVTNALDWDPLPGWSWATPPPAYLRGCPECQAMEAKSGEVYLTFTGNASTGNVHYRILIPGGQVRFIPYDYDMVDATITLDGQMMKGEDKKMKGEDKK